TELIVAILSQNTSDVNSKRAFDRLVATFGSWGSVAEGSVDQIVGAIKGGGLSRIKARRIKAILESVRQREGILDLGFLTGFPLAEAKAWLERLPGVGPKTAACVLLFSLGRPALPVDTHVHRVSRRLGLIDSRVSPKDAHRLLENIVMPEARYQFHLHMLAHGKTLCKALRPLCHRCFLEEGCPKII
ncbi:endonuclease III domain-containing protein, partial [Chloroflexota bacterium]